MVLLWSELFDNKVKYLFGGRVDPRTKNTPSSCDMLQKSLPCKKANEPSDQVNTCRLFEVSKVLSNIQYVKDTRNSQGAQTICSKSEGFVWELLRGSYLKQNIGDNVDIFLQHKLKLTSIVFCRPCSTK